MPREKKTELIKIALNLKVFQKIICLLMFVLDFILEKVYPRDLKRVNSIHF